MILKPIGLHPLLASVLENHEMRKARRIVSLVQIVSVHLQLAGAVVTFITIITSKSQSLLVSCLLLRLSNVSKPSSPPPQA
jgi:hypothetical protein